MELLDGNAAATGLARYVRDFLPAPNYGVAVIRTGVPGDVLLGVYRKLGLPGRGRAELILYESLLDGARVDVVGRGIGPTGESWAVIVRAGPLVHPLATRLTELLELRIVRPNERCESPVERELIDRRVTAWCDWWGAAFGR
jgi:hypothetical protein